VFGRRKFMKQIQRDLDERENEDIMAARERSARLLAHS